MDTVYLNGHYLPKNQATISIMDRGFLFGDSIYEVIPVHHGKLIGGKQHFERLQHSLAAILINCPFANYQQLQSIFHTLAEKNQLEQQDYALYVQVTRGVETQRQHRIPQHTTPTVVLFCMPRQSKTEAELMAGFKAITHHDLRRDHNYIKSTTLLTNVMLLEKGREQGALETILLRDGRVLECTSSNLFIVKDGCLKTPPLSETILAGVTRSLILQFAKTHGIPAEETDIFEADLYAADEIWVCGSTKEICPIVQLNDQLINGGHVGPVWKRMNALYQQFKETCE